MKFRKIMSLLLSAAMAFSAASMLTLTAEAESPYIHIKYYDLEYGWSDATDQSGNICSWTTWDEMVTAVEMHEKDAESYQWFADTCEIWIENGEVEVTKEIDWNDLCWLNICTNNATIDLNNKNLVLNGYSTRESNTDGTTVRNGRLGFSKGRWINFRSGNTKFENVVIQNAKTIEVRDNTVISTTFTANNVTWSDCSEMYLASTAQYDLNFDGSAPKKVNVSAGYFDDIDVWCDEPETELHTNITFNNCSNMPQYNEINALAKGATVTVNGGGKYYNITASNGGELKISGNAEVSNVKVYDGATADIGECSIDTIKVQCTKAPSNSPNVTINGGTINTLDITYQGKKAEAGVPDGTECQPKVTIADGYIQNLFKVSKGSDRYTLDDKYLDITITGGRFAKNTLTHKGTTSTEVSLSTYIPENSGLSLQKVDSYYEVTNAVVPDTEHDITISGEIIKVTSGVSGRYKYGTLLELKAEDNFFYTFDGWYDGTEKISSDKAYVYSVKKDANIMAKSVLNPNHKFTEPKKNTDGAYEISTEQELLWIAHEAFLNKRNFAGEKFVLMNDLTMSGDFYPICRDINFCGIFDGSGHKISNLKINLTDGKDSVGLFGQISTGATIKNLTVESAQISSTGEYGAAIAAKAFGDAAITNCTVQNSSVKTGSFTGSIVGHSSSCSITDCVVDGNTTSGEKYGSVSGNTYEMKATNVTVRNMSNYPFAGCGYDSGTHITATNCKIYDDLQKSMLLFPGKGVWTIQGNDTHMEISGINIGAAKNIATITGGEFTCDVWDYIPAGLAQTKTTVNGKETYTVLSEGMKALPNSETMIKKSDDAATYDYMKSAVKTVDTAIESGGAFVNGNIKIGEKRGDFTSTVNTTIAANSSVLYNIIVTNVVDGETVTITVE